MCKNRHNTLNVGFHNGLDACFSYNVLDVGQSICKTCSSVWMLIDTIVYKDWGMISLPN